MYVERHRVDGELISLRVVCAARVVVGQLGVITVAVRVEGEWIIEAISFRVVHRPDWDEDGGVLGDEHALVPVVL